jgi:hypothetical protein
MVSATSSPDRARQILGANFHGVDEVQRHMWAEYTHDQLAALAVTPFSEETILDCKDTHLLIAGAPLSIPDLYERHSNLFWPVGSRAWYRDRPFPFNKSVPVRWNLIRKAAIPGSPGKSYDEQQKLLPREEEVPLACEVAYAFVLHFLSTGEPLLKRMWMRCADRMASGGRAFIGEFAAGGIVVLDDLGYPCSLLGLASARRI